MFKKKNKIVPFNSTTQKCQLHDKNKDFPDPTTYTIKNHTIE